MRPADFSSRISLAGQWKFKGLDRQAEPFGPVADAELALLSPETDDTEWDSIAVPLNWWADSRFAETPESVPMSSCDIAGEHAVVDAFQ